ncbi:MAG: PBP1A family penicillin-binding protein [Beijerinckiaceae bacterium]|jgi:penicillin-binding protein 1A|nr:PBP1A family penicillin-binding protein [Beijerinckiaceae bacterium]
MLAFDSWVNSSLYDSGQRSRDRYAAFSAFMDRFHVSGASKAAVEVSCEALTIGLAGSVLMLALAVPAFNVTSDDWLKEQDLAVTFLDRYGKEIGRRGIRHDDSVPLEQIPDFQINALLSTEDRRFWSHYGIDPIGTMRALSANARASGVVQGGSTLTQQLAKNLFLSSERTVDRKIKEAFLAVWLEFRLSKREILKLYLDRAYMGGGAFGIQAAAKFYFNKSVRDVTLAEAAMLAGLFKAPTRYAPHVNLPAARARANDVLENMVEADFLTEGQIYAARKNPAQPVDRERDESPDYFLDWAFGEIKKLDQAGKLGKNRVLIVRTTLDGNIQKRAQQVVENNLRLYGKRYNARQAAVVIMESTGAIRAIVGGRDYGASQFNRATDAMRQPGSSFKPFVYTTALLSGRFTPNTIVNDSPICLGNWCPRNYGGSFAGRVPLRNALARSLNTVAVKLSIDVGDGKGNWNKAKSGRAKIMDTARRMGLKTPLKNTVHLPIGVSEVPVIDMATAYGVFATGGKQTPAFSASEIRNSSGDLIYSQDKDGPKQTYVIHPTVIANMNSMLNQVVEAGTARRARLPGVAAGGKTGTTNSYRDAWFIGFTGNYVGAVWYGNDNYQSMNNMTGGSIPAQTWQEIMSYAHKGIEIKPLPGVPHPSASQNIARLGVAAEEAALAIPQRPATLSRGTQVTLGKIEKLMRQSSVKMRQTKATSGAHLKQVRGFETLGRSRTATYLFSTRR